MSNKINETATKKAKDFLKNEPQFKLGFLPVEDSNKKTKYLDEEFSKSIENGLRILFEVDSDLTKVASEILNSRKFAGMTEAIYETLKRGNKIVFSSCGSSGRLCILLESAYRNFFITLQNENPSAFSILADLGDLVFSIMSGGDYALIKAVESFEDYQEFGREQVRELNLGPGDLLIGITATGETSSILGSVLEAAARQAESYFVICVKEEIIRSLERSRQVLDHPNVTVIDMPCEPMAIAGSVRMQAVTLEQLIVGAALETALIRLIKEKLSSASSLRFDFPELDYGKSFEDLINALSEGENIHAVAEFIRFETDIYNKDGLVTYYADDFLLDILTDTAERPPTFSLPAYRKCDDMISPQSWAFAKNPVHNTFSAWRKILGREPRCITWGKEDYIRMKAKKEITDNPPGISADELMKFIIGNEPDPSRWERSENAAVLIGTDSCMPVSEFDRLIYPYKKRLIFHIGISDKGADLAVSYLPPKTPLRLFEHISIKLIMNVISSGCMVLMGRVMGNKMICHGIPNKKLIDRGTRLISEICGLSYQDACVELFTSQEILKYDHSMHKQNPSPVEFTIRRLKRGKQQF